ncbi:MAG: DUF2817 domain-containing protein [Planctomycetota bacterium]|nr:MAG: DUF2817 domain-containing protein [Planctomycetota bacterium]
MKVKGNIYEIYGKIQRVYLQYAVGLVFGSLCCLGCHSSSLKQVEYDSKPTPLNNMVKEVVLGISVQGRPITCNIFGNGDDVVLIIASIHGNETRGTPIIRHLGLYLENNPELLNNRQVLLIPMANPDGMILGTRYNANGIDLNRNFPAANFSRGRRHGEFTLSEPESRAIYKTIQTYNPSRIVSIHQPKNCIDYDGPSQVLAKFMADCCNLYVRRIGGQSGSLGSYAGISINIPIITVELPKSASQLNSEDLWHKYGRMLLAAITYPKPPPENIK